MGKTESDRVDQTHLLVTAMICAATNLHAAVELSEKGSILAANKLSDLAIRWLLESSEIAAQIDPALGERISKFAVTMTGDRHRG